MIPHDNYTLVTIGMISDAKTKKTYYFATGNLKETMEKNSKIKNPEELESLNFNDLKEIL